MTTDRATPIEPPLATCSLTPLGGSIGPEPEHFVVDELPLYEACGEGAHLYVRVQKRELTTQQLLRILSRASGVRDRDIGYAGLKDKHAVTTQWFSFPDLATDAPDAWELPEGVSVLEVSRHRNKLRTGHLAGNRFRITLVEVANGSPEVVRDLSELIGRQGLCNYFGQQRFGREGESLAEAFDWLQSGRRPKSRFLAKLYPSVVQAEVFNRYLQRRTDVGLDRLLEGEVVRLDGSAKMFVVEDVEAELSRLHEADIHLTGPMPGPKMKPAAAAAAALEAEVLASLELHAEELERLYRAAPGTRRDAVVRPSDLRCELVEGERAVLEFSLPAGSYATRLVAEFTH